MDTARAQLLTPPGKGGIAVIRISGPGAAAIVRAIFRPGRSHAHERPGELRLGHLVGPDGQVLDEAIVQCDGDAAMINIHGGPLVARAALDLIARHGASVHASGGESFDPRHPAWDNPAVGREMLRLLPSLLTPLAISAVAAQWSDGLSQLASEALASLSQTGARSGAAGRQGDIAVQLRRAVEHLPAVRRLIVPAEVVLAGEPNVGKSTLANTLCRRQVSIVHERPGTTRDWVRELVLLDGVPIWLTDTAGIWEAPPGEAGHIDAQAVRRALGRLAEADLIVLLGHAPAGLRQALERLPTPRPIIRVRTKADIALPCRGDAGFDTVVSAHSGAGMDKLSGAIRRALGADGIDARRAMAFTDRQRSLLLEASGAIEAGKVADAAATLRRLLRDSEQ